MISAITTSRETEPKASVADLVDARRSCGEAHRIDQGRRSPPTSIMAVGITGWADEGEAGNGHGGTAQARATARPTSPSCGAGQSAARLGEAQAAGCGQALTTRLSAVRWLPSNCHMKLRRTRMASSHSLSALSSDALPSGWAAAVEAIVAVGGRLDRSGLAPATGGNYSIRLADGSLAVTVSGAHKGRLSGADVMRVTAQGRAARRQENTRPRALLHRARL